MYSAVFSKDNTISYTVSDDGTFTIIAKGTHLDYRFPYRIKSDEELALDIIIQQNHPKIKSIQCSDLSPTISQTLIKYKRAVDLIEEAVLNPYTSIGRKRLQRDFARLLEDVVIEI